MAKTVAAEKNTELIVVRHGQTDANLSGRMQGHFDSNLDNEGIRQAFLLAGRLKGESFDAFYCSDLARAMATADIIAGHCALQPVAERELREWNMGALENISYDDVRREYPEIMDGFKFDAPELVIPGGEKKSDFYRRISRFMTTVTERHYGGRILVVAHGGVLQAMLKHVMGANNVWSFLPRSSNTGYNKFIRRLDGWQLCCWNDTAHLNTSCGDI